MADNLFLNCFAHCRYIGATSVSNMATVEIVSGWATDTLPKIAQ